MLLKIENLRVKTAEKDVLKGIDLNIAEGETHVIMGPNGSGKTSLGLTIMGHPKYKVADGKISFLNKNLLKFPPHLRSKAGVFLSFQHPYEISGISLAQFLLAAEAAHNKDASKSIFRFKKKLEEIAEKLKISPDLLDRHLNKGFSGGEKKKAEILQMAVLKPKLAILDEIDSGLDIDALKQVAKVINEFKKENPRLSLILITHYHRLLRYIRADFVHVLYLGKLIASGDHKFAEKIEEEGFSDIIKRSDEKNK